jgi:TrkA domain protein
MKFTFSPSHGGRLAVIQHLDGLRELYVFQRAGDDEPTAVVELQDDEARSLGAVLGGAFERPKVVEDLEMALGELAIEWIAVPDTSPMIGVTLERCGFRSRAGITVIVIIREPEPVMAVLPTDTISRGDTLVTVGRLGGYNEFRRLLSDGPPLDPRS